MESSWRNTLWRFVDLIVGGIFVYAGVIKALEPAGFANDIDNYKMLPWFISVGLAFYLPWLEIFSGLAVILRRLYRGGLSILAALAAIFLVATIAAKVRGLDITCGCFGHASKNWSFSTHFILDLALLAALLISFVRAQWNLTISVKPFGELYQWRNGVTKSHDQKT